MCIQIRRLLIWRLNMDNLEANQIVIGSIVSWNRGRVYTINLSAISEAELCCSTYCRDCSDCRKDCSDSCSNDCTKDCGRDCSYNCNDCNDCGRDCSSECRSDCGSDCSNECGKDCRKDY